MVRVLSLTLFLLVTSHAAVGQAKQPLTVERIFQRPSLEGVAVSGIQWSRDGSRIAYLRADPSSPTKDLWLYDVASGKGSLLVRAEDMLAGEQIFSREEQMVRERTRQTDAGITSYFWSPSGKEIFIPLSGDVFVLTLVSKNVKQLTSTLASEFDPKVSPSGNNLAYVRDNEIYVLDLASRSETRLTSGSSDKIKNGISEFIAQEEMDRTTGYWWAPDGKHIAYLQIDNTPVKEFQVPNYLAPYTDIEVQEYAKAGEANTIVKVGVVSVQGGQTTWLDLGPNTDMYIPRVDWLPDGKRIAVQLQTRNQDTLDLMIFNFETGKGSPLLRETDPRWVSLHYNLRFLQDGKRFLWSSERDGFQHLYLYDMNGKLLNQVTKGTWEVDKLIEVDEKAGTVFFLATEKSPLERHLYSVKLDGSNFKRLSTSGGWHEITMSPDKNVYVDKYSNTTRPPLVSLMSVSKKTATMIEANPPTEFEIYQLPRPEFFKLTATDGEVLNALMIKPPSFDATRKYPVITYVYGGPTSQVVANQWGAGGGMARCLWHRMMAEKGYLVFSVDGRGTPGRGREFQNHVHKQLGLAEVRDQLSGLAYLKSQPYVDTTRIMIWGKSYGGFMTCLTMFTEPEAYKLGIALAPVTDWRSYDTHYTERYLESPKDNPEGYQASSPINFAGKLKRRLLLVHGLVDDNVHFQDSILLADELQKANKQFDFMPYPRSTHAFSGDAVGTHLYNYLSRYIQENL